MNEEQIKEQLLANFCDGDSWNDARADHFTHEGALEIAKYFYTAGLERALALLEFEIQEGTLNFESAINEEINKNKV